MSRTRPEVLVGRGAVVSPPYESTRAPYDVIHSHYWLSGLVGERLKAAWGVPHVVMFHTLGEVKNRASHREHESALRIASEAAIIAGCDRVICATELERTSLRQLYDADPAKVTVIPLGVDLDLFQPTSKKEARAELGLSEDQHIVLFSAFVDDAMRRKASKLGVRACLDKNEVHRLPEILWSLDVA